MLVIPFVAYLLSYWCRELVSRKYGKELAIMAVPNSSPTSQDMEHGSLVIPLEVINMKV
jgi:hypothetical protein